MRRDDLGISDSDDDPRQPMNRPTESPQKADPFAKAKLAREVGRAQTLSGTNTRVTASKFRVPDVVRREEGTRRLLIDWSAAEEG